MLNVLGEIFKWLIRLFLVIGDIENFVSASLSEDARVSLGSSLKTPCIGLVPNPLPKHISSFLILIPESFILSWFSLKLGQNQARASFFDEYN